MDCPKQAEILKGSIKNLWYLPTNDGKETVFIVVNRYMLIVLYLM